jgi:hypothetical protein
VRQPDPEGVDPGAPVVVVGRHPRGGLGGDVVVHERLVVVGRRAGAQLVLRLGDRPRVAEPGQVPDVEPHASLLAVSQAVAMACSAPDGWWWKNSSATRLGDLATSLCTLEEGCSPTSNSSVDVAVLQRGGAAAEPPGGPARPAAAQGVELVRAPQAEQHAAGQVRLQQQELDHVGRVHRGPVAAPVGLEGGGGLQHRDPVVEVGAVGPRAPPRRWPRPAALARAGHRLELAVAHVDQPAGHLGALEQAAERHEPPALVARHRLAGDAVDRHARAPRTSAEQLVGLVRGPGAGRGRRARGAGR